MVLAYAVAMLVLSRFGLEGLRLKRLAGFISMYPFIVIMCIFAHCGTWHHVATQASRVSDSNGHIDNFAILYIASNVVQALGQVQTESGLFLCQLMAHHILSIGCFTGGFYFDRLRFWTALAGLCEVTNLFLVWVFVAKEAPYIKKHRWYALNGVMLWITFVVYRLVLFPIWLYMWYSDQMPATLHPFEKYGYPATIWGLLVLSTLWFRQVHNGLKKSLKSD